jgi:carbonic anhydrase/acetyltransferase-like protein (isoleucine patch superfamily)
MLVEHLGQRPAIDASAHIAPTAVVAGDVTIGPGTCIGFGAVVTAEGGPIAIGAHVIVRENAVIRATAIHPVVIGDHVLVGPGSYLVGCTVGDKVFLATRATIFHDATIGAGAEVRVNGTVHVNSRLDAGAMVPIGWVAVGDPAQILPPGRHDEIWAIQEPLNFPKTAFGVDRAAPGETNMAEITQKMAEVLGRHRDDRIL